MVRTLLSPVRASGRVASACRATGEPGSSVTASQGGAVEDGPDPAAQARRAATISALLPLCDTAMTACAVPAAGGLAAGGLADGGLADGGLAGGGLAGGGLAGGG